MKKKKQSFFTSHYQMNAYSNLKLPKIHFTEGNINVQDENQKSQESVSR